MSKFTPLIRRVLAKWAKNQKARLKNAFNTGGHQHHGGHRWARLSKNTRKGQARRMPLLVTGRLKRLTFTKLSGLSVNITNATHYAPFHQHGTSSMPRRRVVVITQRDLDEVKTDLKRTLEGR